MTARQILTSVVIAAIVMFALPAFFDVLNLTTFAAYALLALSLGFVWGYGGILCFGQTAFYGLGAYVYALTAINTGEAWSGFFLAIVIPALFAAVLGAMMFYGRLSDVYLAVVTLVVSLILFRFMTTRPASNGSSARPGSAASTASRAFRRCTCPAIRKPTSTTRISTTSPSSCWCSAIC